MELIRGLHNIRKHHQGVAATIGNFDGVHLGHQHLVESVSTTAAQLGIPACVISFEPLPAEYFVAAEKRPARLMNLREKYRALKSLSIQQLLLLKFNKQLAGTAASDFINQVLINGLNVQHLLVGDDFKFGRNREGDFSLLQQAAGKYSFTLQQADTHYHDGDRVSSTRIRRLLESGKLINAATLLGRHYALEGLVEMGAQLGRTIGFPTANIALATANPPLRGVFAVSVAIGNALERVNGIANIGARPTVNGARVTFEVHLLDFTGDLYGQRLRAEFLHKIRDEKKFASLDDLKRAISDDEATARNWFHANT
ncbi:riboflavin biosynthesis protein RibF [Chromatiales bacterium (ex Bugula neritina AB1)]|nr:riboflavin biosynthesis protein RibF [Chromatiales bacterium (ex Bugula neritina AB1)]